MPAWRIPGGPNAWIRAKRGPGLSPPVEGNRSVCSSACTAPSLTPSPGCRLCPSEERLGLRGPFYGRRVIAHDDDIRSKAALLRDLGYGGDMDLAEVALQEAGFTNPRKPNIHLAKTEAVRRVLEEQFVLVCSRGDCKQEAAAVRDGRSVVPASAPHHCEFCGGSSNQRAVDEMLRACRARGWTRLCVVGGSPNSRTSLQQLAGRALDLRLVEGTVARHRSQAAHDMAWADVVVVWGSTQLDHKVSILYKGPNVVALARRSIQELARAVTRSADKAAEKAGRARARHDPVDPTFMGSA